MCDKEVSGRSSSDSGDAIAEAEAGIEGIVDDMPLAEPFLRCFKYKLAALVLYVIARPVHLASRKRFDDST